MSRELLKYRFQCPLCTAGVSSADPESVEYWKNEHMRINHLNMQRNPNDWNLTAYDVEFLRKASVSCAG